MASIDGSVTLLSSAMYQPANPEPDPDGYITLARGGFPLNSPGNYHASDQIDTLNAYYSSESSLVHSVDKAGIYAHCNPLGSHVQTHPIHVAAYLEALSGASRLLGIHKPDYASGQGDYASIHRISTKDEYLGAGGVIRTDVVGSYGDAPVLTWTHSRSNYLPNDTEDFQLHGSGWSLSQVESSKDGTLNVQTRCEARPLDQFTLTFPADSLKEIKSPNTVVWEVPPSPWLLSPASIRLLLFFLLITSTQLSIALKDEESRNQGVTTHDHSGWTLCASPARSKMALARLAA